MWCHLNKRKKKRRKKKGYGPVDPKPHSILLKKNKIAWSNSWLNSYRFQDATKRNNTKEWPTIFQVRKCIQKSLFWLNSEYFWSSFNILEDVRLQGIRFLSQRMRRENILKHLKLAWHRTPISSLIHIGLSTLKLIDLTKRPIKDISQCSGRKTEGHRRNQHFSKRLSTNTFHYVSSNSA